MATALYLDDSVTTCDCCGRSGLQCTVAMRLDCGSIVHYGRVCAGRNTGHDSRAIKQQIAESRRVREGMAFNEWREHPAHKAVVTRKRELVGLALSNHEWQNAMADVLAAEKAARAEIASRHRVDPAYF